MSYAPGGETARCFEEHESRGACKWKGRGSGCYLQKVVSVAASSEGMTGWGRDVKVKEKRLAHAARREFFFCGTATQVRRKRCWDCLGRRNLLQRHVTSPLGVERRGGRREEKEKCSLHEGTLALLFVRAFHYAWQRISRTASLTLRLPLKLYGGCKEKADGGIGVKNKTSL